MNKDTALRLALEALENSVDLVREDAYNAEELYGNYLTRQGKVRGLKVLADDHEKAITAIKESLVQTEFIKHEVENADDWSEWVCPDPKNYLMKCCDCGLVHEAQFGVVRYKSETERDDCDIVNDPNLQAVFRMRRSEEWTPEDTAHRVGGLPMAESEPNYKKALEVWLDKTEWVQETVKPHELGMHRADVLKQRIEEALAQPEQDCIGRERAVGYREGHRAALAQRTWVGLTDEDKSEICDMTERDERDSVMRLVEAKLKARNI
jgi:hypothetical protein